MATCKVRLYANTKLKPQKNFVIDDIIQYLSTFTSFSINDFQYQRFEINKIIKVNLSQDYQDIFSTTTKWDYLRFETLDESVTPAKSYYHYYFIKGYRQIAKSTIELELEMDVLNTFTFVDTILNYQKNYAYTLNKKSLITREHKDRFKASGLYMVGSKTPEFGDRNIGFLPFVSTTDGETRTITFDYDVGYNILLYSGKLKYNSPYVAQRFKFTYHKNLVINASWSVITEAFIAGIWLPIDSFELTLGQRIFIPLMNHEDDFDLLFTSTAIMTSSIHIYQEAFQRIIDRYQEGVETYLFKKDEDTLYDGDGALTWYLFYSSSLAVVSDADATEQKFVNPVEINLCSDRTQTIASGVDKVVRLNPQDARIPDVNYEQECIVVKKTDLTGGAYIEVNGVQYNSGTLTKNYVVIRRINNSDLTFRYVGETNSPDFYDPNDTIAENVAFVDFYGVNYVEVWSGINPDFYTFHSNMYIGSGSSSTSATLTSWKGINTTDPKLIKAINLPYCPVGWLVGEETIYDIPDGYVVGTNYSTIEVQDSQDAVFDREIHFDYGNPMTKILFYKEITQDMNRDDDFESKLFHSDYWQPKFVYDSYSFGFALENIDVNAYLDNGYTFDNETFIVRYCVSANVLSKFMFQFNQYVCDRAVQDYENILIIDRNNEKALFNNAYINYIRSGGFSYDTKKANSQNAVNGIMTALSIVGAVASFASSPWTGGAGIAAGVGFLTATTGSIVRNIHTAQEQDRAISQKMLQLQNQATSVNGNEDVDILKAFSGNKAKMVYYEPSDIMKQAIADLFYYCGYATHEEKIPDVNTRKYFNFVQGEIILDEYTFNEDIAKVIIDKWKNGVTFIHKYRDASSQEQWDINQEKENLEMSYLNP